MTRADLPAVARIAAVVHPAYPEDPAVAAERLALDPAGCFVFDGADGPSAYLLSHRWVDGAPPALDTHLHALPAHPNVWYIHDIALMPETRGLGAARGVFLVQIPFGPGHRRGGAVMELPDEALAECGIPSAELWETLLADEAAFAAELRDHLPPDMGLTFPGDDVLEWRSIVPPEWRMYRAG